MKKVVRRISQSVVLLVACCVMLVSCSSLKHVSASRFLELTEDIPVLSTIRNTEFIGTAGARVYLQRWQMRVLLGPEITVYWTDLSGLPENVLAELNSGRNTWLDAATEANQPMQSNGPSGHR